ncbi:MAG: PHP domain-containing protein [Oscillospiraceae bacterium]|nr:PHP domain-containing protein [Oscillospiraceae bacterium]
MLIDLHAHTSGISACCQATAEETLKTTKEHGLDGIVLTNHYQKYYVKDGNAPAFAQRYWEEFLHTEKVGKELGMRVLFGIEVTMTERTIIHLLVYGVGKEFLDAHPFMYDYSQEELYRAVKDYGGVLVQAHPYRNGASLLDPQFLDGVEINCHSQYNTSEAPKVMADAKKHGLFLTCGGDYHADTYRPHCGMILPDSIQDGKELGQYLATSPTLTLCIHEPFEKDWYLYTQER